MTKYVTKTFLIALLAIGVYYALSQTLWRKDPPAPVVATSKGLVQGGVGTSRGGRSFNYYLGLPYAKAPVGDLRFEDPKPAQSWAGVRPAVAFGNECLQIEVLIMNRVIGAEDCLFLNVFSPYEISKDPKKTSAGASPLLPVMVYIHGGLFMGGSSIYYRGKYFMDHDVVLVTLNYRVAALGFLSSGDEVLRGNQGLKDQTMALQWVQENIAKFGGDPKRVTLFGESAGGACVHYHMISPLSAGLFHRAIAMSGTAMRTYTSTRNQTGQLRDLGAKLGCAQAAVPDLVACLKRVDGLRLVETHRQASEPILTDEFALYVPTHDVVQDSRAFFSKPARKAVRDGESMKIPFIAGVVAYEGLLYVSRVIRSAEATAEVNQNWFRVFPTLLKYDPRLEDVTRKIKRFYFGDSEVLRVEDNVLQFADMISDRMFIYPTVEAVLAESEKNAQAFMYYMTYQPKTSTYALITSVTPNGFLPPPLEYAMSLLKTWFKRSVLGIDVPRYGPGHGDELSLLFDIHPLVDVGNSHVDFNFSQSLVSLWAAFAQDKPLVINNVEWKPSASSSDSKELKHLILEPEARFEAINLDKRLQERIEFWRELNLPFV